jgi:hypothetical protein
MSYQYLTKNREIDFEVKETPCFVGVETNYSKNKHKYFAFLFPARHTLKDRIITKKWVMGVKDLYNFKEYLPKESFDWKNNRVIFDLEATPGHIIFAICTCVRYLKESSKEVFGCWVDLSDTKKYNLTTFEKFLFLHFLEGSLNDGHAFLYYPHSNFDKFIAYQPPKLEYCGPSSYGRTAGLPRKDFILPFNQYPQFRTVGLNASYTPRESRESGYGNGDGSFTQALKERTIA